MFFYKFYEAKKQNVKIFPTPSNLKTFFFSKSVGNEKFSNHILFHHLLKHKKITDDFIMHSFLKLQNGFYNFFSLLEIFYTLVKSKTFIYIALE